MTSHFSLYMTGQSDPGQIREYNEDAVLWDADRDFALLADGMGGHNAGDVASRMCLEELNTILASALDKSLKGLKPNKGVTRQATLLRRAVGKANAAVFEDAQKNPEHRGMGTTVVATLFYDSKVVVAHLGDSRIYRFRKKALEQITSDHSLVQELLDQGVISDEEAEDNPYSHVITQAVGIKPRVIAEVNEFEVIPGDVYLLCSDGLTDMVKDEEIAEVLAAAEGQWERAAQRLVDVANNHGGHDNISVVLVGVGGNR